MNEAKDSDLKKTPKEITPRLLEWQQRYEDWQRQYEALRALTQCGPESPICAAMGLMWDAYTECLEREVGDADSWLSWYCWENDMGAEGHEVKTISGKTIKVRTVKQLARVICY